MSSYSRRKKGKPNTKKQQAIEKKLQCLSENLNPVPFTPHKIPDFSRHEALLRKIGLWDFVHLDLDKNIRKDLVVQLIATYDQKLRGSYVNDYRVAVNRADLARALKLPSSKEKEKEKEKRKKESDESVSFIEELVCDWVLLHEDAWQVPTEVLHWMNVIKEGHLEKVDWASLFWFMVEKELNQGEGLRDCYYASHLQYLIRFQHEDFFLIGEESTNEKLAMDVEGKEEKRIVNKVDVKADVAPEVGGAEFKADGAEAEFKADGAEAKFKTDGAGADLKADGAAEDGGVDLKADSLGADSSPKEGKEEESHGKMGEESAVEEAEMGIEAMEEENTVVEMDGKADGVTEGAGADFKEDGAAEGSGSAADCKADGAGDGEENTSVEVDFKADGAAEGAGADLKGDGVTEGEENVSMEVGFKAGGAADRVGADFKVDGTAEGAGADFKADGVEGAGVDSRADVASEVAAEGAGADCKADGKAEGTGADFGAEGEAEGVRADFMADGTTEGKGADFIAVEGVATDFNADGAAADFSAVEGAVTDFNADGAAADFIMVDSAVTDFNADGALADYKAGGAAEGAGADLKADTTAEGAGADFKASGPAEGPGADFNGAVFKGDCAAAVFNQEGLSFELNLGQEAGEKREEDVKDAEMIDLDEEDDDDDDDVIKGDDEDKEEEQQEQWLFDGRNEHFLQRCSMEESRKIYELEDQKEEDEEEEEGTEDGYDDDGFPNNQNAFQGNGLTGNLLQAMETSELGFGSQAQLHGSGPVDLGPEMLHMDPGPSVFNDTGKRVFDHDHDDDADMAQHTSSKRLRINEPWNQKPVDFGTCMGQMQQLMEMSKMMYEEKEHALGQSNLNQQILMEEVQKRDNMINHLHKARVDEIESKDREIYRLERELYLMKSIVDGYRKALKDTQKAFAEYREKAQLHEEPVYRDAGPGGLMLSVGEIEKLRKRQEEEYQMNCAILAHKAKEAQEEYDAELQHYCEKINMLDEKLKGLEAGANELRDLFAKRKGKARQTEESVLEVLGTGVIGENVREVPESYLLNDEEKVAEVFEPALPNEERVQEVSEPEEKVVEVSDPNEETFFEVLEPLPPME